MTVDLQYLAYTAMLTAALWIPYVVSQVKSNGMPNWRDPSPRPLPEWGKRADRVYLNAVEAFAPFAALVLVAHVTGKADAMTAMWCMVFFWARLVHAIVYLLAVPVVRTVAFTVGFVAVAGIFFEVIR